MYDPINIYATYNPTSFISYASGVFTLTPLDSNIGTYIYLITLENQVSWLKFDIYFEI